MPLADHTFNRIFTDLKEFKMKANEVNLLFIKGSFNSN